MFTFLYLLKNKCEYYWPNSDQGQVTYGEIKVTLENTCEKDGYIVSQLKLENIKVSRKAATIIIRFPA